MSGNANQNTFISRNNSQLLQNPSQPSTLSKIAPEAYDGLPRTLSEEVNDRFGEGEQTGTMSCMLHRALYPKAPGNGFKTKKPIHATPPILVFLISSTRFHPKIKLLQKLMKAEQGAAPTPPAPPPPPFFFFCRHFAI